MTFCKNGWRFKDQNYILQNMRKCGKKVGVKIGENIQCHKSMTQIFVFLGLNNKNTAYRIRIGVTWLK